MSQHPDERGAVVPDDRLLVRPYVTPAGRPSRVSTPAWPLGPGEVAPSRAPDAASPQGPDPTAPAADPERPGNRLPLIALALLALAGAGALVFLVGGPDPAPSRSVPHPGLALPVLPAGSPGADATAESAPDGDPPPSGATRGPSGPAATTAPATAPASARPGASPARSGSAVAKPPAGSSGTLRPGDSGPEVRALQERLRGQGFTYVSPTGVYDRQTERGVAQLQRDRDIHGDPSGTYGPATRAAFG
ncbi:peptidoglycan-binding protein [Streptomyces sp. NPDC088097]|uniref:peptidoglycan-binding protein n=1 Tax=Streptomyces sp. NPDC088097 TaxID=3365823 RepID=UPI00381A15EE